MDGTLADIKNSQMNTTRWKRNISCHCGVFVKYKKRYTQSMMTDLQTVDSKKEKKHFTLFVCTVEIVISGFKNLAIFCLLFNFRLQKKLARLSTAQLKCGCCRRVLTLFICRRIFYLFCVRGSSYLAICKTIKHGERENKEEAGR